MRSQGRLNIILHPMKGHTNPHFFFMVFTGSRTSTRPISYCFRSCIQSSTYLDIDYWTNAMKERVRYEWLVFKLFLIKG